MKQDLSLNYNQRTTTTRTTAAATGTYQTFKERSKHEGKINRPNDNNISSTGWLKDLNAETLATVMKTNKIHLQRRYVP